MRLAIIVEGHGETESFPVLIRRIFNAYDPSVNLVISKDTIFRVGKGSILKEGGLEKAARTASIRLGGEGTIILLLDSDGSCPAQLGPALLARLRATCQHVNPVAIVAHQEYENWFIHAIESLSRRNDFNDNIHPPDDPDIIRDAKGWIAKQKLSGKYSEILDQPSLSASIDLDAARRSDSFDKLYREIGKISK